MTKSIIISETEFNSLINQDFFVRDNETIKNKIDYVSSDKEVYIIPQNGLWKIKYKIGDIFQVKYKNIDGNLHVQLDKIENKVVWSNDKDKSESYWFKTFKRVEQ